MEKVVIFDIGNPKIKNNQIFDRAFAYTISHTLLPLCYLYEEAKKNGITFITPDIFLNNPKSFKDKRVFLISHLINSGTEKLIKFGAIPLILLCQESPFIATRFYVNLRKYSELFKYSMLFPSMKKRVSNRTHFIPTLFPQFFSNEQFEIMPFYKKKYITYIASNKEVKNFLKIILIKILYGFNVKMIYPFRKKIIKFLSQRNDFDLYGKGWTSETSPYIKKVYKGEVIDKEKKLREYKFVLCLENSIFPGNITEKIFDCFFALSIPVYLGAPDINKYIPKNTFIDINDFKNLKELESYLNTIDESTYNTYIENIKKFLHSDQYIKFSHQKFAETIINLIKSS